MFQVHLGCTVHGWRKPLHLFFFALPSYPWHLGSWTVQKTPRVKSIIVPYLRCLPSFFKVSFIDWTSAFPSRATSLDHYKYEHNTMHKQTNCVLSVPTFSCVALVECSVITMSVLPLLLVASAVFRAPACWKTTRGTSNVHDFILEFFEHVFLIELNITIIDDYGEDVLKNFADDTACHAHIGCERKIRSVGKLTPIYH